MGEFSWRRTSPGEKGNTKPNKDSRTMDLVTRREFAPTGKARHQSTKCSKESNLEKSARCTIGHIDKCSDNFRLERLRITYGMR